MQVQEDLDADRLDITTEDLNFDEIDVDLERFQEDEMVQQALQQGVDLKRYGRMLEKDLKEVLTKYYTFLFYGLY